MLRRNTQKEWFINSDENGVVAKANAQDMAFFFKRQGEDEVKEGWTSFNKRHSDTSYAMTSIGYMPMVIAPAHDMDTLNTVVLRCKHVARTLGQNYVVITVDEALFCKLMELKWANADYQNCLVVRLGGLHTLMTFMGVIGKHVQSSGLMEAWIEANVLGPKTAEQVLHGKSYARGMRVHKITLQSMWRLLLPSLLDFIEFRNPGLKDDLEHKKDGPVEDFVMFLASDEFRNTMEAYLATNDNPNFKFWWGYMQMVHILLLFLRAQRDGIWVFNLHAFQRMLPYFMRYNNVNYARWGTIYLNEMHQLPQEVQREFESGNFVVKRSPQQFNQVDPDQSQEWLGCIGKKGGGIIGITKFTSALSRWALSFNFRSHLANESRIAFGLESDDECSTHNETTRGRMKRDSHDKASLLAVLQRFGASSSNQSQTLQNIANKDLVSQAIEIDLLTAAEKGQDQLTTFVEERLLPIEERRVTFRDKLPQNKYLTFASLFELQLSDTTGKAKTVKADRNILQRLIAAYEAGRPVNLNSIMMHELFVVPLSLAEVNGELRTGPKAILADILTTDVPCPNYLDATDLQDEPMLVIDGQALVFAIGKPQTAKTFGELADVFVDSVLQSGALFRRIGVLFDRYKEHSIKRGTRKRRGKGFVAIRRPIESRDVPLPTKWENFITHEENKADLARFLSQQLILSAPDNKCLVVAGGFSDEEQVEASDPTLDISSLEAKHEEADTRVILHCIKATKASDIVVAARDTDILVLLIAYFHLMPCQRIWMKAGTAKQRKYVPVHNIIEHLQMEAHTLEMLPGFHALTGSDTTSYLAGHTKKTCWGVFVQHADLLRGLGVGPVLSDRVLQDAESFFCKIYGANNTDNIDGVRASMFVKGMTIEQLPPTRDALYLHIRRSHYQTLVWRQAHLQYPILPQPEIMGWKMEGHYLVPKLTSLPPVPDACQELITCTCTTGCKTARCGCKPNPCTASCKCKRSSDTCMNQ